jgi:hypothetical protein
MNDSFHAARAHVSSLASPAITVAAATLVLRTFCAERGLNESSVASELAAARAAGKRTKYCGALGSLADQTQWTHEKPARPGFYGWRKSYQWEYITGKREVRLIDGVLKTYAHRVQNWVPLNHLDAGGSEWSKADLTASDRAAASQPEALVVGGVWAARS